MIHFKAILIIAFHWNLPFLFRIPKSLINSEFGIIPKFRNLRRMVFRMYSTPFFTLPPMLEKLMALCATQTQLLQFCCNRSISNGRISLRRALQIEYFSSQILQFLLSLGPSKHRHLTTAAPSYSSSALGAKSCGVCGKPILPVHTLHLTGFDIPFSSYSFNNLSYDFGTSNSCPTDPEIF